MDLRGIEAPEHFTDEGRDLWQSIFNEFDITAEALPVLKTAIEHYDRMNAAREVIAADGFITTDPSGRKRIHPAIQVEKEARSGFLQAWRLLGLNAEIPGEVGRPPGRI